MTGAVRVQTKSMGVQTTESNTALTSTFTSAIAAGNYMLVLFSTRDSSPGNYTVSDDKSNTWTNLPNSYSGLGAGGAYCLANAGAQAGAPTITIAKNGTGGGCAGTMFEINAPSGAFLDSAVTPLATNGVATAAQITLGSSSYDHDLVLAVLACPNSGYSTSTPLTGYTSANNLSNSSGNDLQHGVIYKDTTTAAAFTPGWTLSVSTGFAVLGLVIKGTTTAPTITGVDNATPNQGGSLTLTGVNFGATQGTGSVSLGGTSQPVTAWSDTSITVTVARGTNAYGVALNTIVTVNGGATSNTSALVAGIRPQSGWAYVTLVTPNATSANRITAIADLAAGDQLAYDTKSGMVSVYSDATFSADASVASFSVESWFTGNGWGSTGLQTTIAATVLANVGGVAIASVVGVGSVAIASVIGVGGISK